MKKDIHPEYREVVFKDLSCDYEFMTRSTVKTEDTIVWKDGKEYPLVKLDISSGSHPFFTGEQKLVDTAGRIDRLKKKFGNKMALGSLKRPKAAKEAPKPGKDAAPAINTKIQKESPKK